MRRAISRIERSPRDEGGRGEIPAQLNLIKFFDNAAVSPQHPRQERQRQRQRERESNRKIDRKSLGDSAEVIVRKSHRKSRRSILNISLIGNDKQRPRGTNQI